MTPTDKQFLHKVQAVVSILQSAGLRLREAGVVSANLETVVDTPYGGVLTLVFEHDPEAEETDDDDTDEVSPEDAR